MVKTALDQNASNIFISDPWNFSADEIKNYFSQFGRIINIYRAVNADSGAPRGFGFISFVQGTDLSDILLTKRHNIGRGSVAVRKYNPLLIDRGKGRRSDLQPLLPTVQADENDFDDDANDGQDALLLLLSGVKKIITADMLKDYFSQFGRVLHLHMTIDQLTKEPRGAAYLKLRTKMDARTILGMQHNVNGVRIIVKERSAPTGKQNASVRCPLCPVNTPVAGKAPRHSKQLNPPTNSPVTQACKELSPTVKVNGPCLKATNSVCTRPHQTEEDRFAQRMLSTGLNPTQSDRNGSSANSVIAETSEKCQVVDQLARKLATLRSKRAELIALKTSLAKPNCGRKPCKKRLIREITSATDQLYCHAVHAFETAQANFTLTSAQEQTLLVKLRHDCTDLKERKSTLIRKATGLRWSNNSARLNEFKVSARALLDELNKLRISVDTCNANGISNASVSRRFETIHLQLRDFHLVTCDSVSFPETWQPKAENRHSSNTPSNDTSTSRGASAGCPPEGTQREEATPSPQPSCMTPSTVPACCSSSSQAVAAAAASPANSTVVNSATPSSQPSCLTPSAAPGCCSPSSQAVAAAAAASAAASPVKSTVVNRDVVWVRGSQGWQREQPEQTERSRDDNGEERKTGKQKGLTSNNCGQSAEASYEEWTHGSYERVQQQIQLIEQACRERERERMERERLKKRSDKTCQIQ